MFVHKANRAVVMIDLKKCNVLQHCRTKEIKTHARPESFLSRIYPVSKMKPTASLRFWSGSGRMQEKPRASLFLRLATILFILFLNLGVFLSSQCAFRGCGIGRHRLGGGAGQQLNHP